MITYSSLESDNSIFDSLNTKINSGFVHLNVTILYIFLNSFNKNLSI